MNLSKTSLGWQLHLSDQEIHDLLSEGPSVWGSDIGLDAFRKAVDSSIFEEYESDDEDDFHFIYAIDNDREGKPVARWMLCSPNGSHISYFWSVEQINHFGLDGELVQALLPLEKCLESFEEG